MRDSHGPDAAPGCARTASVLDDLLQRKLPALAQVGVDVSRAEVVLFSRSGFAPDLRSAAAERGARLVDLDALVVT